MPAFATRSVLSLVLVVVIGLALTGPAAAKHRAKHGKSHPSSAIAIDSVGPDGVSGLVSSDSAPCRGQREVTLYRVNTVSSIPSGEPMGSTWTRADGSWTVPGALYPSEYYALLEAKTARGVVCGPATSNFLHWG